MADEVVFVNANIRLLPTTESGRTKPVLGMYRPNHNFFEADNPNMTVDSMEFPRGTELHPGENMDLPVKFFYWPGLKDRIYPGREWRIQEGARLIGMGTVIEILPAP